MRSILQLEIVHYSFMTNIGLSVPVCLTCIMHTNNVQINKPTLLMLQTTILHDIILITHLNAIRNFNYRYILFEFDYLLSTRTC